MMKRFAISALALTICLIAGAADIQNIQKDKLSKEQVKTLVKGLETTAGGRMWIACESSVDNTGSFITFSCSDNSGKSWVETMATGSGDVHGAFLWLCPDSSLWAFATVEGKLTSFVCSDPDSKTPRWSEGKVIGEGTVSAAPLVDGDAWLLPFSQYGKGAGVMVSRDNGQSWAECAGRLAPPANAVHTCESTLLKCSDGSLKLVVRGSDNVLTCTASFYQSRDGGSSWEGPFKFVDNPDRHLCLRRLEDGRLLMVKNGFMDQNCYIMPYNLVCYLSDDDGQTWYGEMKIASDIKSEGAYATTGRDGNIHIAYSWDEGAEVRLLSTTADAIEAVYGKIDHTETPGKTILKAGRKSAFESAQLKSLFAPRKNWADKTLRIGTYNIQYRNPQWEEKRLPALERLLAQYDYDVFGSQEPYRTQIDDMMEMDFNGRKFGDVYDFVGRVVTDKDGDMNNHYNPIFFKKERLELLDWGLEWFTDAPGKAGFGAYSSRQCCWAHFRDKATGKEFFCLNSHPDHLGVESREQASAILINLVKRISGGLPCFLSGDFNADEDSRSYKMLLECGFLDDSLLAAYDPINAEYFSMSHYKPMSTVKKSGKHIDHVFYTPHASKILSWELITYSYNDYFGSDHLPIICEWKIAD